MRSDYEIYKPLTKKRRKTMPRPDLTSRLPVMPVNRYDYLRHHKPQLAFIPSMIGLLRNNPNDPGLKKFLRDSKADANKMLSMYEALPSRTKIVRYSRNYRQFEAYNKTFKELLEKTSKEYREKMRLEDLRKKEAVRKKLFEFKQKSPQEILKTVPKDAYELIAMQKYMRLYWKKLAPCCETTAGAESTEGVDGKPPITPKKYAFRINRMKCNEQEDWTGDDDIYFVTIAVDGNGKVLAQQSPPWEMDTDQSRFIYYNVYPMQSPNDFLDISVRMYEVNGSYESIGNTLIAVGAAASGLNVVAGAALGILGAVVNLLGDLDDDDDLGTHNFTFNGAANLRTSVGTKPKSYLGDGADYDVTFQLIEAA